jgi:Mn2+/Fe2+ NRAMP family transporter
VGPSFVWCAEYIGSGEVILATRAGAILGPAVLWAIVVGISLKYWIGMSGARYTVCTGESMIDMFARMPGPCYWVVWLVLVAQFAAATISIGSLASAAGVFLGHLLPGTDYFWGWLVAGLSLLVVWNGVFDLLRMVMSLLVLVIVLGVLYVAATLLPDIPNLFEGLPLPAVPQWAIAAGAAENPWNEILPLLGWAAGGFASQVWYTYWVLGAGYGAASGREYGRPADLSRLRNMTRETARKIKGWCRVVYVDATLGMFIGLAVTAGFLIAGAAILRPQQLAPQGEQVAIILSQIFASRWGSLGGLLFLLSGATALIGTQIGQLAGWPRLLADCTRICVPRFGAIPWRIQYRIFLILFLCTNMIIVYTLGIRPVFLLKLGAVLDGLLLTPLQAIWIAVGLYVIMPKLLSPEAGEELRPHWSFGVGLLVAFLVFGYFCLFQIPFL